MNTTEEILNRALALPMPDRASLAHQLLLSLEPEDFDDDSETAWAAEIDVRLSAIEHGGYQAGDWREAMARIRLSLNRGAAP